VTSATHFEVRAWSTEGQSVLIEQRNGMPRGSKWLIFAAGDSRPFVWLCPNGHDEKGDGEESKQGAQQPQTVGDLGRELERRHFSGVDLDKSGCNLTLERVEEERLRAAGAAGALAYGAEQGDSKDLPILSASGALLVIIETEPTTHEEVLTLRQKHGETYLQLALGVALTGATIDLRRAALNQLGSLSPSDLPDYQALALDEDPTIRFLIYRALSRRPQAWTTDMMIAGLSDSDRRNREICALTLGVLKAKSGLPALAALLRRGLKTPHGLDDDARQSAAAIVAITKVSGFDFRYEYKEHVAAKERVVEQIARPKKWRREAQELLDWWDKQPK
jgi:hypothetical protein